MKKLNILLFSLFIFTQCENTPTSAQSDFVESVVTSSSYVRINQKDGTSIGNVFPTSNPDSIYFFCFSKDTSYAYVPFNEEFTIADLKFWEFTGMTPHETIYMFQVDSDQSCEVLHKLKTIGL